MNEEPLGLASRNKDGLSFQKVSIVEEELEGEEKRHQSTKNIIGTAMDAKAGIDLR